jgi:hypothetical protein
MKICHFIHNLKSGGAQTFLSYLVIEQAKDNDITVLTLDRIDDDFSINLKDKVTKHGVNVIEIGRVPGNKVSLLKSLFLTRRFFIKNSFDIINTHLHLCHLFVSLIKSAQNHVMTIHNGPEDISKISLYLNKDTPKIFCSNSSYELNDYPKCKYSVIENGVPIVANTKNIKNNDTRETILHTSSIPQDSKIVLCVGALRPQKNYKFLTKLVKEYFSNSNVHFIVCGGYAGDKKFKNLSEYQSIKNIHFIGITNKIDNYLIIADLFLSCSLFEGLPISVLEAVFKGIPCVLSPIKPHIDIFSSVEGVMIPDKFEKKYFAEKINLSFKQDFKSKDLINNRLDFIKKYNIKRSSEEYLLFYKDILN